MSLMQRLKRGRWKPFNTIVFLCLLSLNACGDRDETNKQRFLIRGNEALAQQNYREANRLYSEALVIDSCYVPALNNIGIAQFEQQHYGQAILYYDRALLCNPEDYNAQLNRSNAFYESGELYRAEDDLLFLQKNHPDSAAISFRLGIVHAKMKDFRASVSNFNEALDLSPELVEAWINRGTSYYYLDELTLAESDLRKALQLSPEQGHAYNTLSMIYTKRGNLDQAITYVNSALGFEPGDPYFLNNLGYIQLLSGELEKGRENIDNSIARDPSNAWAYRNKGRYYYLKEQYRDALSLYERALREDDFVELIHTFRGDAYQAIGETGKACSAWRKGVEEGELASSERLQKSTCL